MLKRVVLAALVASLVVPLAAQAPAGWKMRLDHSKSAQDPDDKSGVTFMASTLQTRVPLARSTAWSCACAPNV